MVPKSSAVNCPVERFSAGWTPSTFRVVVAAIAAYHVPLGGQSLGVLPVVQVSFVVFEARRSMVPLQTPRCICLSCARHDFTLDRHLSVWWRGHSRSQSAPMQLEFPKGNVPGYVCNHGSPRERDAASHAILPASL